MEGWGWGHVQRGFGWRGGEVIAMVFVWQAGSSKKVRHTSGNGMSVAGEREKKRFAGIHEGGTEFVFGNFLQPRVSSLLSFLL